MTTLNRLAAFVGIVVAFAGVVADQPLIILAGAFIFIVAITNNWR